MKQDLQILFMVFFAVAIAFALLRFLCLNRRDTTEWLILCGALVFAAVISHNLYVVLIGLILIKLFYTGNDLDKNMTMFLFLLPILPTGGQVMLPAPNINFVIANYTLMAIIVFLMPILPKLIREANLMDRKILLYFPVLFIVLREIPFLLADTIDLTHTVSNKILEQSNTGKTRDTIQYLVKYILPYYAMVSWINSDKRLNLALFAICTSGLVMMIIAVPSGVLGWDFFRTLFSDAGDAFRFREGRLRLNVNMEHSITFGYYVTICLGALLALVSLVKLNVVRFALVVICALPAIFFTISKGAMVGALISLGSFFYFKMQGSSRKISSAFFATLLLLIAMPFLLATSNTESRIEREVAISEADSFEYRKQLAIAELSLIVEKPLFGYPDAFQTPEMEAMRQGEGIIDPVNTYLTLALTRGVICLVMYLILIYAGISGVLRYARAGWERRKTGRVMVGAALAATYLSISVQMIFTSFNGMISVLFWIVSGICMGVSHGMNLKKKRAKGPINFGLIKEAH